MMRDLALAVFGWTLVLAPILGAIALVIKALRDRHSDPDWTADLVPDARQWRRITTDEAKP